MESILPVLQKSRKRSLRLRRTQNVAQSRFIYFTRSCNWSTTQAGYFKKYNGSCNCWMCKYEKKAGIEKRSDRKKKLREQDDF